MHIDKFPGWRWGKDHPEGAVFEREEDVPKGYVDDPNLLKTSKKDDAKDDGRAEIVAKLKAKHIKFFQGATTEKLAALLAENGG